MNVRTAPIGSRDIVSHILISVFFVYFVAEV
jgi:hypothetical protein